MKPVDDHLLVAVARAEGAGVERAHEGNGWAVCGLKRFGGMPRFIGAKVKPEWLYTPPPEAGTDETSMLNFVQARNPDALKFGLVANVAGDRVLRDGARVWLVRVDGSFLCPVVFGASKGGRLVEKYTHFKRLTNIRPAWVPWHLHQRIGMLYPTRERAQEVAAAAAHAGERQGDSA